MVSEASRRLGELRVRLQELNGRLATAQVDPHAREFMAQEMQNIQAEIAHILEGEALGLSGV